jgi:polyhydroxyalkanoate synthesis regulator phasin
MSKSRDEQLQDLKNSARELKRVYDNNKRRIAEVTAEINDKKQKITDIRSELSTLPKSRKTAKMGELERLEQRVPQLEVILAQETGKQKNVRQLLFKAIRTLRLDAAAGQAAAAAAAPSDDDDSDDDSGAGVGSRRASPRSSSRDACAAGPAVPAGAMAVAVPASAQRRSPSPKRGCWPWSRKKSEGSRSRSKSPPWWKKCFSRKNKDGNPPPTGGRRSKTRKLKTRNTYKKRCASRK